MKRKLQKILILLLCLSIVAEPFPANVDAAEVSIVQTWTTGECTATFYNTGELIIKPTDGISGAMPDYVLDLQVVNYSDRVYYSYTPTAPWFSYCTTINKVTIKDGVTNIGDYSFANSYMLYDDKYNDSNDHYNYDLNEYKFTDATFTMPATIKYIGKGAFQNQLTFNNITIPDSVTEIREDAYRILDTPVKAGNVGTIIADKQINSIRFGKSVITIGNHAFDGYGTNTTPLVFPETLETIGNLAFNCPQSFTYNTIVIPDAVTTIGTNAFYYANSNYLNTNLYSDNTVAKSYNWYGDGRSIDFTEYPYGDYEDPDTPFVTITTPYISAPIEYSFDNTTWQAKTTDSTGSFRVVIPANTNRIFIRLVSTGETKYADITNGTIGVWGNAKPIITSQSQSPTTLLQGAEGILYVEAEPFAEGNTVSYQWVKDGTSLGSTGRILSIPTVKQSDAGTYTCIVTESDGKFNTSNPIIVTVKDPDGSTADLLEEIETLTHQVTLLQGQLEAANSDKDILSGTIVQLQTQITGLQTQITGLQNQVDNLETALSQAGSDKEALNAIIISLNGQITILTQRIDSLETELKEANDSKTALQNTVEVLNTQITNLTNQLTVISHQLEEKEEENTQLKGQITVLNTHILQLNSDIDQLEQEINNLTTINTTLQGQLNEANQTIHGFISLITLIKAELGITEDEDIITAIQNLKTQLQGALSNNTELINQIHIVEAELKDALESNTALNTKLEELIVLVGAEDSDNIRIKIIELQDTITTSKAQITVLEQEKAALLIQLQTAFDRITELQNQLDTLLNSGNSIDELREQILLLTKQINQVMSDNETLTDSINKLNLQVIKLTTEKLELQGEIARLESLLATANSTIEELRQQLAEVMAEKTVLQSENKSLKEENTSLKNENASLKSENSTLKDELKIVKSELEKAQTNPNNSSVPNTPNISLPDNAVVITPAENKDIPSIINNEKTEPVSGGKIIAEDGWEVADSPTADFSPSLSLSQDSYVGIYSFYDKSLNVTQTNQIQTKNHSKSSNETIDQSETKSLSKTKVLPFAPSIGTSVEEAVTDKNGYVKYTFYARKTADPSKIYQCSLDIKPSDYITPVTSLSSSVKNLVNSYSEINTYDIKVKDDITFTVDADFGSYGRKAILYQLVPANKDFDPDGDWKTVKGNTIKITKVTEPERLYIKYLDKGGNYTVDKTVGFMPSVKSEAPVLPEEPQRIIPVFTLNKTVYLGYDYQVQFTNLGKDSKISYTSSNSKIAKVNKSGIITAVSQGKAVITGTVKQGTEVYQYILKVTVSDGKGDPTLNMMKPNISSTGDTPIIVLYKQVKKNAQTKLELTGVSQDAIVTYLTSDAKTVGVSREGVITGKQKGTGTITVLISQDGKQYIYLVKVRVDDGTKDEDMYEYLK